jgi:ABC-type multidrug transport system ATPase subunit
MPSGPKGSAAVRRRIGLTGQQATVNDILTGRENLVMWGRLFHLGRRAAARRADELLEQLGPTDAAEVQPGGGGQHVGSARTVADARVAGHAR